MKSITIVIPSLKAGGAEKVSINFANQLTLLGVNVDLISFSPQGEFSSHVFPNVNFVSFKSPKAISSLMPMLIYLILKQPEYVISNLRGSSKLIGLLLKLPFFPRTTFIIREAGLYNEDPNLYFVRIANRWILRFLYHSAHGFIANSRDTLASFCEFGILSSSTRKVVIGNPVIPNNFNSIMRKPVNHPWLINKTSKVIVSAGRFASVKDFSTLIYAFSIVRHTLPDTKLILLGDGYQRPLLDSLISKLSLTKHVSLPGFKEDPCRYFFRSDLFVSTSLQEGFGNVIVEALACNTIVICSDCPGGPRDILQNGQHGVLFPVGDSSALAQAIINQLQNPSLFSEAQVRSHQYKASTIALRYLNFISSLV
ncbi:glycosyltransferase [bacterium]|nr:glycosyltransferase [bacterium]